MNGNEEEARREYLNKISPSVLGWRRGGIEEQKDEEEEEVPTKLNTASQSHFLVVSTDKLSVQYTGSALHGNDVGAVRANCAAPVKRLIYYFEITVRDKGEKGCISIGFTSDHFKNGRHPGWEIDSYGYHGDDGVLYHGSGKGHNPFGPIFSTGDTVGAGINYATQEFFFTKNGQHVGVYPKEVKGALYPTIGLHSKNEKVDVNFGEKPFLFDIEQMAQEEREKLQSTIEKMPLSHNITHSIVRSYLLHYGYQETLESFDIASGSTYPSVVDSCQEDNKIESYALNHRKTLRQFIRNGDVDAAFNKLREWYPQLVEDEKSTICFLLHCQKYIELIMSQSLEKALSYAQTELPRYYEIKYLEELLKDCAALLAYEDPKTSSVGYLLGLSQRELVADAINAMILTTNPDLKCSEECLQSTLEKLLRQLSVCCLERRAFNGGQGEIFSLQKILHGSKKKVL